MMRRTRPRLALQLLALLGFALVLARAPRAWADDPGAAQDDKGSPPLFSAPPASDADLRTYLHFTPVRHGPRTILWVWGTIAAGDAERFQQAVKQAGEIEEVQFLSGGGDLGEGLQIGRIMRANGLVAHVPAEFRWGGRFRAGGSCASACNFMFLGGIARSIDPGAKFIVHMFDRSDMPGWIIDMLEQARARADATVRTQEAAGTAAPGSGQAKPEASVASGVQNSTAAAPPPVPQPRPSQPESSRLDEFLRAYGCSERSQLQPDHLGESIAALLDESGIRDPGKRASLSASLETMTIVSLCIEQDDASTAAEIAHFLVDMRLSLRFLTTFAAIPNAHARALSRDELRDFNVVNTE